MTLRSFRRAHPLIRWRVGRNVVMEDLPDLLASWLPGSSPISDRLATPRRRTSGTASMPKPKHRRSKMADISSKHLHIEAAFDGQSDLGWRSNSKDMIPANLLRDVSLVRGLSLARTELREEHDRVLLAVEQNPRTSNSFGRPPYWKIRLDPTH
jgi:hypothetical protein